MAQASPHVKDSRGASCGPVKSPVARPRPSRATSNAAMRRSDTGSPSHSMPKTSTHSGCTWKTTVASAIDVR